MNAQQQMVEYAKSKMNPNSTYTPDQWCGKMIKEGVRCNDGTIARARREGKTIVITETSISEKNEIVNGKLVSTEIETTEEVLKINL